MAQNAEQMHYSCIKEGILFNGPLQQHQIPDPADYRVIASCDKVDRTAQVQHKHLSDFEVGGKVFREKVLMQLKTHPGGFYLEMDGLCRETFIGKPLEETNAMMRAAGQAFDLTKSIQAAVLIPPGTTPYGGGFSLHSSLISGTSFNVTFTLLKLALLMA